MVSCSSCRFFPCVGKGGVRGSGLAAPAPGDKGTTPHLPDTTAAPCASATQRSTGSGTPGACGGLASPLLPAWLYLRAGSQLGVRAPPAPAAHASSPRPPSHGPCLGPAYCLPPTARGHTQTPGRPLARPPAAGTVGILCPHPPLSRQGPSAARRKPDRSLASALQTPAQQHRGSPPDAPLPPGAAPFIPTGAPVSQAQGDITMTRPPVPTVTRPSPPWGWRQELMWGPATGTRQTGHHSQHPLVAHGRERPRALRVGISLRGLPVP